MSVRDIEGAAAALFAARRDGRPIPPVRDTHGIESVEDAYAVQSINTVRMIDAGGRLTGRKIGLTSKTVQQQLGVDQPDFGMLWGDQAFAPGAEVAPGRFMQPKLEGEIAFVMGRALDHPDLQLTDVMRAVDYVVPAFEIVDSAIADWNIRLADTIADNASGGGYMLGDSPRLLAGLDLRLCGMVLSLDGEAVSLGVGAACLGHPLHATLWLARTMMAAGRPLQEGDIVLSGALGPMVPARAGARFTLEVQGFDPLSIRLG